MCARFAPVLHHFFLEHYREPAAWFERRLAYTRATAVNSMAGYVIGLGDRHSHNILIHTRTAEACFSANGTVTSRAIRSASSVFCCSAACDSSVSGLNMALLQQCTRCQDALCAPL